MRKKNLLFLAGAVGLTVLPSCVDDDYNLSDIDTTVELKVKDLTLPLNLDPIQLKSILKPSDDSSIKELDGEYAVLQEGTFSSDDVIIDTQRVPAKEIKSTVRELEEDPGHPTSVPGGESTVTYSYVIDNVMGDFSYEKTDIPAEILGLRYIGTDWTISIDIHVTQSAMTLESMEFEDVVVNLPKGLYTDNDSYDPSTGDLVLGTFRLPAGTESHRLDIKVSGVDLTKWDVADFTFIPATDLHKGEVHLSGHVGLKSGFANLTVNGGHESSVTMTMTPSMSDILVESFSGRVKYTFSNLNVPDVDIHDLPDLLADDETSIILANPQLYLTVNNPVANYGLDASAGLEMTPYRNGIARETCALNPGQSISVAHDKGIAGPYTFCISPETPESYYDGFEGATQVYCSAFANILSGDGVPTMISVNLPDARVIPGDVDNFILGRSVGKMEGSYTVYCPLEIGAGTKIVYTDVVDGWNDDTVDRIVIDDLKLTTTITNGLPFDVVLTGYPLSLLAEGAEPVQSVDPVTRKEVTLKEVKVAANSTVEITTSTDGVVEHLDGIRFVARAVTTEDDTPVLSPEITITLDKIKVTVTGSYVDEL